jgi:hypothetical protein
MVTAWGLLAVGIITALAGAAVKVIRALDNATHRREIERWREREQQLIGVIEKAGRAVPDWPRSHRRGRRREREAQ